ncbi:glucan 1,3-beta-glucosidase [Plectosphaerella plurivora]|uniref:Glucan 1,3-beta-glucosidase n=1 Tax=Plectosphaerella plurivora TaxID=936078 RepID=A0A9P8VIE6_9PEZI|nr:glucan 1,3-beta-glucosidase [Plectosphaerella plurivora]
MHTSTLTFLLGLALRVAAQDMPEGLLGFNSGATMTNNRPKEESDFEAEFTTAQRLRGSPGSFNSVRLYTMIQAGTRTDPISAFPAAIKTNTSMLLGIWCSGTTTIENELAAMNNAIEQYGQEWADLVVGVSVGSEDLYRASESGVENDAGPGQDPDTIVRFIQETRAAMENTILANKPVIHVDTWSAWSNSSNTDVIQNVNAIGTDLYPYYEDDKGNAFSNTSEVFDYIYNETFRFANDTPVWVTETGHPHAGPEVGESVASEDNSAQYWQMIGCGRLFGRVNTFWYNLRDSNTAIEEKFGITEDLSTTARFNLTCPADSGAPAAVNLGAEPDSSANRAVASWAVLGLAVVASCIM